MVMTVMMMVTMMMMSKAFFDLYICDHNLDTYCYVFSFCILHIYKTPFHCDIYNATKSSMILQPTDDGICNNELLSYDPNTYMSSRLLNDPVSDTIVLYGIQ